MYRRGQEVEGAVLEEQHINPSVILDILGSFLKIFFPPFFSDFLSLPKLL